jgi:hypothetical protein
MSLKRLASAAAVLATVAGGLALTATAASADTTDQVSKADVERTIVIRGGHGGRGFGRFGGWGWGGGFWPGYYGGFGGYGAGLYGGYSGYGYPGWGGVAVGTPWGGTYSAPYAWGGWNRGW